MITFPCHELYGFCYENDDISAEAYTTIHNAFKENGMEEFLCDWRWIWGVRDCGKWKMYIRITEIDVDSRDCIIKWYNKKVQEDIKNVAEKAEC